MKAATAQLVVGIAAVLIGTVDAHSALRFRNAEPAYHPVRETGAPAAGVAEFGFAAQYTLLGSHEQYPVDDADAPVATAPPTTQPATLDKRASTDNTCGYVSGIATASLYCDVTDQCVINKTQSIAGCCPDTSINCPLFTACLPLTQSARYTTPNSHTLLCNNTDYPECITHVYADSVFTGYSLLGCGKTKGFDSVYYQSTSLSLTSRSSASSSSPSSTLRSTSSSSTTLPGPVTTTSTASSPESTTNKKSTNTGAIVGGVVGGVGGAAVLALAAFFIFRYRRKNVNQVGGPTAGALAGGAAGGPPGAPGGAPQQPPMVQQPYYAPTAQPAQPNYGVPIVAGVAGGAAVGAAAAYDPAGAAAYDPTRHSSLTPTSPGGTVYMPQSPPTSYNATPPPQPGSTEPIVPYAAPPSAPGMTYQSGPVPAYPTAELSSERPDSELRELA